MQNVPEQKYLSSIIKLYETGKTPLILNKYLTIFLWIVFFLFIMLAKRFNESGDINIFILIGLSILLGASMSAFIVYRQAFVGWYFIKQHIDIEKSVKKRVIELKNT